jgi:hypothetical protein
MWSRWMPVLTLLIAVVATAAIWLVGRSGRVFGPLPAFEPTRSPLLAKDGNVFLYVGSMAFEPRVVDICVKIDGKPAVHDSFEHDLTSDLTRYRLRLARGSHQVSVVSERGQASLEQTIEVSDELHVSVAYFYGQGSVFIPESPPCFTLHAEPTAWIPSWGWRDPP